MIIGGNEDKSEDGAILGRVAELSRTSPRGHAVGLVTTASKSGGEVFHLYRGLFERLGVDQVLDLTVRDRRECVGDAILAGMRQAACLFFTGGDQLRITSVLGGTPFHRLLLDEHRRGLIVAGTSAGASMMSDTMIVTGEGEESPAKNTVRMAPGMGLWKGAVIDQHFSQRGRIGRLLSALAQNPGILGVGLDEDTAIEVRLDAQRLTVWGSRTVTLLDGSQVELTNASESRSDRPLAISGVKLHVLPQGFHFDLNERIPLPDRDAM
jgi:cyanophycinase